MKVAAYQAPYLNTTVTVMVGFTEHHEAGNLFSSAAVISDGRRMAVYRKVLPAYRTVIRVGPQLPVYELGRARSGIVICNDLC